MVNTQTSDTNKARTARKSASAELDQDTKVDVADTAPVRSTSFSGPVLRIDSWSERLAGSDNTTMTQATQSMDDISCRQDLLQEQEASTEAPLIPAAEGTPASDSLQMNLTNISGQVFDGVTAVDSSPSSLSAVERTPSRSPGTHGSFRRSNSCQHLDNIDSLSRQNSSSSSSARCSDSIYDQPTVDIAAVAVKTALAQAGVSEERESRDEAARHSRCSSMPAATVGAPSSSHASSAPVGNTASASAAADSFITAAAPDPVPAQAAPSPISPAQSGTPTTTGKHKGRDKDGPDSSPSSGSSNNTGRTGGTAASSTGQGGGWHLPAAIALGVAAVAAAAGAVVWWLRRSKQQSGQSQEPEDEFEREMWRMEQEEKALEAEEKAAQKADAAAKKKAAKAAAAAPPAEEAELSAEQKELTTQQAEAKRKEKVIADALAQGDAELAAIDAMGEEELANLDADELAALEAELAELEGLGE